MGGKGIIMKEKLAKRHKKSTCLGVFLFTAFVFLLMPFGQAFGLTIDNFGGTQNFFTQTVGNDSDTYSGPGAIMIGGSRTVDLHYLSGSNKLSAATSTTSGFNIFTFSEDSGVNGTCEIVWNANIPYDLTDGGSQTSFLFRWMLNDHPLNVIFRVTSGGSQADYVFNLDGTNPIQNLEVPFSSFAGVDMTNVTRIEVRIPEGEAGLGNENDFSMGPITTEGVAVTCNKTFSTSTVDKGDVVTATVTITASGNPGGQATVDVVDSLDAGLLYEATGTVDPPDSVSADLRTLTWTGVVVNVGTPVTLRYNVLVNDISPGQTLCNNVQVFASPGGTLLTQCKACVKKPEAPVPTFSEWGLMVLTLVLLGTALLFFRRRRIS
jgi:hypothetical protein